MQNQIFPDREIGHDRAVNGVKGTQCVIPVKNLMEEKVKGDEGQIEKSSGK